MKKEELEAKLRQDITALFEAKNFTLTTEISEIKTKSQLITYTCKCGEEKVKPFKEIERNRECRNCKSKKNFCHSN